MTSADGRIVVAVDVVDDVAVYGSAASVLPETLFTAAVCQCMSMLAI